jgi:hypothetical protein
VANDHVPVSFEKSSQRDLCAQRASLKPSLGQKIYNSHIDIYTEEFYEYPKSLLEEKTA